MKDCQSQYQQEIWRLKAGFEEAEAKVGKLAQELEVLSNLYAQKEEEANKWQMKFSQSEQGRIRDLQELKVQFENYKKINIV